MDIADGKLHSGASVGSRPLYYHVFSPQPGEVVLQYWMWFNGNDLRQLAGPGEWHEGDWEYVAISLSNSAGEWVPQNANFHQHTGGITYASSECWWSTTREPTYLNLQQGSDSDHNHLHVWVAANSHATYNRYQPQFYIDAVGVPSYRDHVDFNLTDSPYGDHPFLVYDRLVNMGESTPDNDAHGCTWILGHRGPFLGASEPADDLAFVGWMGERHCPDGVPSFFCDGGFGLDLYYGSKSPIDPAPPHEWRGFTVAPDGWGNEGQTGVDIAWGQYPPDGSYLGWFVMSQAGTYMHLRFAVPTRYGKSRAQFIITSDNVQFVHGPNGFLWANIQPDGTYVFDECMASGEGHVRFDVKEEGMTMVPFTASDLVAEIAQPTTAAVGPEVYQGQPNGARALSPVTGGVLRLRLGPSTAGEVVLSVFGADGRLVAFRNVHCDGGEAEIPWTFGGAGVHFVRMSRGGRTATERVVVLE